jgi:hypothetical protein
VNVIAFGGGADKTQGKIKMCYATSNTTWSDWEEIVNPKSEVDVITATGGGSGNSAEMVYQIKGDTMICDISTIVTNRPANPTMRFTFAMSDFWAKQVKTVKTMSGEDWAMLDVSGNLAVEANFDTMQVKYGTWEFRHSFRIYCIIK